MLAFAPLLVFIALQIKLHDRGPVLFRQTRTGKDGREFSCLKFRTMVALDHPFHMRSRPTTIARLDACTCDRA